MEQTLINILDKLPGYLKNNKQRAGQAIFNLSVMEPNVADKAEEVRGNHKIDCFYKNENILAFIHYIWGNEGIEVLNSTFPRLIALIIKKYGENE